jgi:hypothetical protein
MRVDAYDLMRLIVLPRLRQLEEEVRVLRKHTWPYVQAKKETSYMDDIESKREFFNLLDDNTALELLRLKSKYSRNPGLQGREFDLLRNHFC